MFGNTKSEIIGYDKVVTPENRISYMDFFFENQLNEKDLDEELVSSEDVILNKKPFYQKNNILYKRG